MLVRYGTRASYDVAVAALEAFRPDVVVGFSWGGSLACRLLTEGKWAGPTLLLAPAHRKMHELMRRPVGVVPLPERTTVVHSRADAIVPIEHSRALCRAAAAELIEVDDEPHKLWGVASNLPKIVLELADASSKH